MQTMALSASTVAVLRFEIKGWRAKNKESRLPAYRELVAAGIMEPVRVGGGYRFTEEGWEHREAILDGRRNGSSGSVTSRPMRVISRKRPGNCSAPASSGGVPMAMKPTARPTASCEGADHDAHGVVHQGRRVRLPLYVLGLETAVRARGMDCTGIT